MLRYLLRRLLLTIPVLLGVATLVFSLIHLVPGDPAQAMLGDSAPPEDVAKLRQSLGLDRPLLVQYRAFLGGIVRGDLGNSFRYGTPVTREIGSRLVRTIQLALAAMAVAILVAIPLGIIAAVWKGSAVDHAAMTVSLVGISMPNFWLGPLLAILFSVVLGWLPVAGTGSAAHLVLPAVTLGAALAAILARMTRASVIEELRELYVVAARARGVSRTRAIVRHAFRNSLIPIVTIVGLQFGAVLTGTIITETIFAWPGVGRLLIQAINFRDYPLVQGCILFISITYVAMNLLTDLTYRLLDPRLRLECFGSVHSSSAWQWPPRSSARSSRRTIRPRRISRGGSRGRASRIPSDWTNWGATSSHASSRALASRCSSASPSSASRRPSGCCSARSRSEEHTSELQSQSNLVCRLLLEKKKKKKKK